MQCSCKIISQEKATYIIETENLPNDSLTMSSIVKHLICTNFSSSCCVNNFKIDNHEAKVIIIKFSSPITCFFKPSEIIFGKSCNYISHIEVDEESYDINCFHGQEPFLLQQNDEGNICMKKFGLRNNVRLIALSFDEYVAHHIDIEHLIYGKEVQKNLQKNICP